MSEKQPHLRPEEIEAFVELTNGYYNENTPVTVDGWDTVSRLTPKKNEQRGHEHVPITSPGHIALQGDFPPHNSDKF